MVDNGWTTCGAGAEIVARVVERLQGVREVLVRRLGFAPTTCPPTPSLEELYYPDARTIAAAACDLVEGRATGWLPDEQPGRRRDSVPRALLMHWPLMHNNIARDDLDAVIRFLTDGDPILTQSKQVQLFEQEWSEWLGVPHSVFVNSGLVGQPDHDGGAAPPLRAGRGDRADAHLGLGHHLGPARGTRRRCSSTSTRARSAWTTTR